MKRLLMAVCVYVLLAVSCDSAKKAAGTNKAPNTSGQSSAAESQSSLPEQRYELEAILSAADKTVYGDYLLPVEFLKF